MKAKLFLLWALLFCCGLVAIHPIRHAHPSEQTLRAVRGSDLPKLVLETNECNVPFPGRQDWESRLVEKAADLVEFHAAHPDARKWSPEIQSQWLALDGAYAKIMEEGVEKAKAFQAASTVSRKSGQT